VPRPITNSLSASMQRQHPLRGLRERRAGVVDDGHRARAAFAEEARRRDQVGALAGLRETPGHQAVAIELRLVERDERHRQRGDEPAEPRHHQVGHVVRGVVRAAASDGQRGARRLGTELLAERGIGGEIRRHQTSDCGRSLARFVKHP